MHAGEWIKKELKRSELYGKTLGILGLGRIGVELAKRAAVFGMKVIAYDPFLSEERAAELGVRLVSLEDLMREADFISVNCPHTPATYHLLSARRLALLQPHAVVVNTSRGEVIDENALTKILTAGDIAGAGLDVFEHEPAVNPKLLALDNVVLLPHMSSATYEGRVDMGDKVVINIQTFVDDHTPPDLFIGDAV